MTLDNVFLMEKLGCNIGECFELMRSGLNFDIWNTSIGKCLPFIACSDPRLFTDPQWKWNWATVYGPGRLPPVTLSFLSDRWTSTARYEIYYNAVIKIFNVRIPIPIIPLKIKKKSLKQNDEIFNQQLRNWALRLHRVFCGVPFSVMYIVLQR